ncbi:hypothetical protein O181_058479 [Austropuccinia psidii MF-1]|uniref:Uncharacterized protein n=1 Tax=Austropuccinia psidii MF-1 TaxID=1389203 RepID=A0A9Q3ECI4_9BASI|nr:hypothetical protein [Austropuccinia psidii MF-1]
MAKDCAGRRVQGVRIIHSKPENFINEDGPSNWAPVNHLRPPSPSTLGKVIVLWSWTLPMGPGHMGEVVVYGHSNGPMDPLELRHIDPVWPQGTLITPTDRKRYKGPKKPLLTILTKMARTQNSQEGPKWPNLKDNGDKTPPWVIPKVNQDEEDPRGPTGWSIIGIYIHIYIIHQYLSRRAPRPSLQDTTQGPCL